MAGYLTYANYLLDSGTTYTEATVLRWISRAESEIDTKLTQAGLTGSTSSETLESAAVNLTAVYQYTRMLLDANRLKGISLGGGMSISDNPQESIDLFRKTGLDLVDQYIEEVNNPDSASANDFEQTVVRGDHQMKNMHLDQSTVTEYNDRAGESGSEDP